MLDRRDFVSGAAAASLLAMPACSDDPSAPARIVAAGTPAVHSGTTDPPPSIHRDLAAHGAIFARRIHRVGDTVYSAVGWSGCNTVMIVGSDGVIIVDTGSDLQSAQEVAGELRSVTDKPIRAIIYTCSHIDHISGVRAFASPDDVNSGRVAIIAHETLLANVIKQGRTIAPILGMRTGYNFGSFLDGADIEGMNNGTGPRSRVGKASFIAPTMTFRSALDISIAGVAMSLKHAPSEASDEIAVLLPESRILLSSEVIPAQHFPGLYPLRGEAYRDPVAWYRSIDALRRLKPAALVPAHGVPLIGEDKVDDVMRNFRDAIQFVHDQTVRHMNKGLCPDELAEIIALPPHLAGFKPWMQEFFGSVSQSVRAIYQGYLGWFEADPVALAPLPRVERSRREIELMGGRDHVLAAAQDAFEHGETQWAAELATRIIRVDQDDMAARRLKAAAFRRQGYGQINAIWRNWYLSAARELDGFDLMPFLRDSAGSFVSPDLIGALPARTFFEFLATRVKAEDTLGVTMTVGYRFPDIHEEFSLQLRRGVVQVEDGVPDTADLVLTLDKAVLDRILLRELTTRSAILGGQIHVERGSLIEVARFSGYFELPVPTPIRLVVR